MKRALLLSAVALTAIGSSAPALAARRADRTPPAVAFTTEQGSVRAGAPAHIEQTTIAGTARDTRSRVARVTIIYCEGSRTAGGGYGCNGIPSSRIESTRATVDCRGRRCTWTARVPTHPGRYLAFAEAVDGRGNARIAGPLELTVI